MFKRRVLQIGQTITLVIAIALIGWLMVATAANGKTSGRLLNLSLLWASLIFVGIVSSIIFLTTWLQSKGASWLVAVFGGLTLLKIPLLFILKIKPTSDFWNYHTLAAFSAQGLTWKQLLTDGSIGNYVIFPHAINIANFFSFGAAFWGDGFVVSQLINIGCTLLDLFLLYWLVSRWLTRALGIAAALIFYWLPAYWLYSSLLNGAEPIFLTCILIAMLALTNLVKPLETASPSERWLNLGLAIVASFVANMVRPIMLVWLIALGLIVLGAWLQTTTRPEKRVLKQLWLFTGVMALLMMMSPTIYSWLYGFKVAPNQVSTSYSLATGTSPKTTGAYDDAIMAKVTHELKIQPVTAKAFPKITTQMQQATQQHLKALSKTGQWRPFLTQKMQKFMAEDYGYNWILYNLDPAQSQRPVMQWWLWSRGFWNWLALLYFEALLGTALISGLLGLWLLFFKQVNYLNQYFLYVTLLLDGFTISSMLVEVQGRYHIILYLPLILLIICGWVTLKSQLFKVTHDRQTN